MAGNRIAIIGAGPIGIEAALYARALGHDVIVLERGTVGANVRSWGFVTMFSPWGMNSTPLGWKILAERGHAPAPHAQTCPSGDELCDRYLAPLAASPFLRNAMHTETQVLAIGKDDDGKADAVGKPQRAESPFRILIRDADGRERVEKAHIVLDCSGTYHHHRWAGRGDVPAPGEQTLEEEIWYQLPDVLVRHREHFIGRHTFLLGAGYSAATVLLSLERLVQENRETRVSWAVRRLGQAMQTIENDPLEARANLVKASLRLAADPPSWLQFLGNCVLEGIEGNGNLGVTLKYRDTDVALAVDEMVAMVGYGPDNSIYQQLQVFLTAGESLGPETLKNPAPNFYVLGSKSFGTNSSFLVQTGHRQIRDVFKRIHDDPALDLYA